SRPLSLLFPFSVNAHISPLFPYTTLFRSRDDLDALGRIRRLENRIAHPVDAAHGPLVEADLLERAADALHDVALDRRDEPLRVRSEEHTSELQSRENLVCRLLLEKKKYHQ